MGVLKIAAALYGNMSTTMAGVRLRFDARLSTRSQKGEFPMDTIAAVYVTNRDGCTYREVPVRKDGMMQVDFEMRAVEEGVRLTDRVKFHFFFRDNQDNLLKPVCAGHMELVQLADLVKDGGEFEVGSNFNTNVVRMSFQSNAEHSRDMHVDLLQLYQTKAITKSVLSDSERHLITMKQLDEHIASGLDEHTLVMSENGGHMFRSIFTAHMMQNEAALYSMYHIDFDEPHHIPKWLCTYLLAETLHHNAVTIEQVKAMDLRALTDFIASYAQAPMRSASATPYTKDETLVEDPVKFAMGFRAQMSEVFKRPCSHPYHLFQGKFGTILTDDCEGLVVVLQNLTNHLGYIFKNYAVDFKQADSYVSYNNIMKQYFPSDLFANMSSSYQNRLMDMAIFLGEHIAQKTIECKVTLASANAASMGGEGNQTEIQAHACASMVCNDPKFPYAVMLEGTSCVTDDQNSKRFKLGERFVTLADVATSLSMAPPFNTFMEQGLKTKIAVHLTHSHGSFYRTAFCQNDALLGSQIGQQALVFGVDMEYLSDDSIKVYMPVTGKLLGRPAAFDELKQYVMDRRAEIHLPLVDHGELRGKLNWAPMHPFKGCKELKPGRPFTTCLVHVLADGADHTSDQLLARAAAEAEAFNSKEENLDIGVMRAFKSMDGVSKVLHLYTDDTTTLSKRLGVSPGGSAAQTG